MCMSLFSHSVIHLCIVCVCVCLCAHWRCDRATRHGTRTSTLLREGGQAQNELFQFNSSYLPSFKGTICLRDGARRCTWSWILWSGGDFLIRSCLCPATGVYVIHRRMQKNQCAADAHARPVPSSAAFISAKRHSDAHCRGPVAPWQEGKWTSAVWCLWVPSWLHRLSPLFRARLLF